LTARRDTQVCSQILKRVQLFASRFYADIYCQPGYLTNCHIVLLLVYWCITAERKQWVTLSFAETKV